MKHLSGLDATFLYLETPEMPMHVGGLNLIELPDGYDGDFYDDDVDLEYHIRRITRRSTGKPASHCATPCCSTSSWQNCSPPPYARWRGNAATAG